MGITETSYGYVGMRRLATICACGFDRFRLRIETGPRARGAGARPATAPVTPPSPAETLTLPGLFSVDLDVLRQFPISERFNLRFRTDMFNVGNTPHFVMPSGNASVNSGTFMEATSIANTGRAGIEQRAVRFSLELDW